jgi:hypothetical protein
MAVPNRPTSGAPIETAWGDVVHDSIVAQEIQVGSFNATFSASSLSGVVAAVFPHPFAGVPTVMLTPRGGPHYTTALTADPTAAGFSAQCRRGDGTSQSLVVPVYFLAIGPRA